MTSPAPLAPAGGEQVRRFVGLLLACSFLLGLMNSLLVKPGVPCDEPAHFQNVRYYAVHRTMPVLGQAEVSYEGQMGPVYYTLAAVIYRFALPISPMAAFYAVRWAGVFLLPAIAWLAFLLAKRLAPNRLLFQAAVTLFMAWNPYLIAISGSVQNDTLAIFFALTATHLLLKWTEHDAANLNYAAGSAVLVSLAILTKATTTYLALAIPVYLLCVYRRKALRFTSVFAAVVLLCSGWWFQRNVSLYGDLSAQQGLSRYHYTNIDPPRNMLTAAQTRFMVKYVNANYWLPREYYETNHLLETAPRWLRWLPIGFAAIAVIGWGMMPRHYRQGIDRHTAFLLGLQYIFCFAIYLYVCHTRTFFAPRTTFPTMIIYACVLCTGLLGLTGRFGSKGKYAGVGVLSAALLAVNFYYLRANAAIPYRVLANQEQKPQTVTFSAAN